MRVALAGGLALLAAALAWADSPSPQPAAPSVVQLAVAGTTERVTGFAVGGHRVVSVAHAVEAGERLVVREAARGARLLRLDRRADLALFAVPGLRGESPRIASAGTGSELTLLVRRRGRPAAVPARVRRAIVAHVEAPGLARPRRRPALELEAHVRAGDSGAPVVTEDGELAGVLFARSRTRANRAYAVDAAAVRRLLRTAG